MTSWKRKDLLGLRELEVAELNLLLETALGFKKLGIQNSGLPQTLAGKTLVNLFAETSTRTRISFELAAKRLGAAVINFDAGASSLSGKGESLRDTLWTLEAMGLDFLVLRHASAGAAHFAARLLRSHVVNAGDGAHEHPTQGLLNALTLLEVWGGLKGKRIAIIGDILHSRVARSDLWMYAKLGAQVMLGGPEALVPRRFERLGARLAESLDEALEWADAILMLRIQHERQGKSYVASLGEYRSRWGLTPDRLRRTKPDLRVMHVGPMNRGVEIDGEAADDSRSTVLQQVTNGVVVRMAVLHLMAGGRPITTALVKKGRAS